MIFHAFSPAALESQKRFEEYHQHSQDAREQLSLEKIAYCDYQILLIAKDELSDEQVELPGIDEKTLTTLSEAWRSICNLSSSQQATERQYWKLIDSIGESIPFNLPSTSLYVRRFQQLTDEDFFFILLTGEEPLGLPVDEILVLSNLYQLKKGRFTSHSAVIEHNDHLYLFSGPSGAGKSTIAMISSEMGDKVIDHDQVLIRSLPDGGYSADGWGYGNEIGEGSLRAILDLVQDTEDKVIPISKLRLARIILERHNDVMGNILTEELMRQSFHFASEMARQVPGFELHFRKSPDFWKLIDAQFAD